MIFALQVAYIASGLFLDYKSDLIILVVNTLSQDLKSDNYLVGAASLPPLTTFSYADSRGSTVQLSGCTPGGVASQTH